MKTLQIALPLWLRAILLAGVFCIVAGAALIAYRFYRQPTILTVAVGSFDGEAQKIASIIAGRLATTDSPVRLKVDKSGNALDAAKAFAAGTADLAVPGRCRRSLAGSNRRTHSARCGDDRGAAGIADHQHCQIAGSYRRRGGW
jgi:hypothetical protein